MTFPTVKASMSYLSSPSPAACSSIFFFVVVIISGNESVYAKKSNALNTRASMPSKRTMPVLWPTTTSFVVVAPKSSRSKTDDRASSTHRCDANLSPPTSNTTSAPVSPRRRSPRSDGGPSTSTLPGATSAGRNSVTTTSHRTAL
uniref:Uncharacterized protein n=1 Tax=Oryza nivara TaxID=4536 RepID=A0A0E0HKQ1_ORYNI